jgi:protein phosphatase
MVADDEADQTASKDAFELLYRIVGKRLRRGRLTVVDATNVRARERKELLALARAHRRPAVAIVFDLPLRTCQERNLRRTDRVVSREVVRVQHRRMRLSLPRLKAEGSTKVFVFRSAREADATRIARG